MTLRQLFALGLLSLAIGCQPTTSPTSRPAAVTPTEPTHKTDIRIRTPGADIDIDARKRGTTGRSVDVDVEKRNP